MKNIFNIKPTSKIHLIALLLVAVLFTPNFITLIAISDNSIELYAFFENPVGEEEERESEKDEKEKKFKEFPFSDYIGSNSLLSLNLKNHLFNSSLYTSIGADIILPPPKHTLV